MALFDAVVSEAEEKFDLSGKGKKLLAILLAMISDKTNGGFTGFLEHFNKAGLGDTAASWITSGANLPLSYEQTESAFGETTLKEISEQAGLDYKTTTSATAFITPHIINELTPEGVAPKDVDLAATIAGLTGIGAANAANVTAADFAENKTVTGDVAGNEKVSAASVSAVNNSETSAAENGDSSILRILLPLLLLGLVIFLGYKFCGNSETVNTVNQNINTNVNLANNNTAADNANVDNVPDNTVATVEPSFVLKAENGKYIVSGTVSDEAAKKQIMDALTAQFGAENVDFTNLKVDANAKNFAAGWWDNFSKLLPDLKNWKTGALSFNGNTIDASGLPQTAVNQIKTLFASDWRLPASIAGEESVARQANEDALTKLTEARSADQVVQALNLSVINFASNKSDIPEDAKPILDKAAEVLNKLPAATLIEIGGHTDSDGDDAKNLTLSQERADAVRKALVQRGVDERLLITKGYGETQPVAENDTPDNKFKNRRIAYKLITDEEIIKRVKFGSNSAAAN